jgi:IclR family acetate operon transcriptional repressor
MIRVGEPSCSHGDHSLATGVKLNQSVRRAVSILRAAAAHPGGETASALSRAAGLPWATTLRLIRTLEEEGFLTRVDGDRYVVGFDLIRLVRDRDYTDLISPLARPALERLAAEVEETVNLTLVDRDGRMEVVEQIDPDRLIVTTTWTGRPYPLHASSIGKLLLATSDDAALESVLAEPLERLAARTIVEPAALRTELGRIRELGYSEAVDELEDGLAALSVGINDRGGRLVTMVSVSGPSFRFDAAARDAALVPLREAATAIERGLGARTAVAAGRA